MAELRAAYPRPHRSPRYKIAAGIVAGVVLAVLGGSLINLTVTGSGFALVDLAGLFIVGLIAAGTYLVILAVDREPHKRGRHLLRAGIVFAIALALFLFSANLLYANLDILGAIACIPTSALALWVIRRVDYNEREPWRLILVAFVWGAVGATTLALVFESLWGRAIDIHLIPGPGQQVATAFSAALLEEGPKGIAVLLLFLVMRDEFDDVVDGIVYGAAIGIGFNFMETIVYISVGGPAQWFLRQVLGLFLGHPTYTALIGAGVGVARQLRNPGARLAAIAAGFLAAMAAHFAWDAWLWYFPRPSEPLLLLLSIPLQYLLMTGPFAGVVIALLVLGLRVEGRALKEQLQVEAALPDGAVLPGEVPILISPTQRFLARWRLRGSRGWKGYGWARRLQRAQIDLAMERWHRARQEIEEPLEAELRLRDRVLAIRRSAP